MQLLRDCFHMKLYVKKLGSSINTWLHYKLSKINRKNRWKWKYYPILFRVLWKIPRHSRGIKQGKKSYHKMCLKYVTVSINKLYGGWSYLLWSFRIFTVRVFSSQMSLMSIFSMIFYYTEEILCFMYPQHWLHWCF